MEKMNMDKMVISTVESDLASTLAGAASPETRLYSSEDDEVTADTCDVTIDSKGYPFALVLRLRVMQIVCGISAMVMGTVALIEERGQLNLGLGVPAGGITVIAAALSIHYSRGFSGYQPGGCTSCTHLRWLGPNPRTAALLAALWGTAALLVGALGVRSFLTLLESPALVSDVPVLAAVQLALALMVIITAALAIKVDCSRDPD